MKLLFLTIISLIHLNSYAQLKPDFDYVYSQKDSNAGQIETAKRVNYFMHAKKYDEAIALFSHKHQTIIATIRTDEESFAIWCSAWTLSKKQLKRYIADIENGSQQFVFEEGMWK